jgi:hypothetical protein
MTINHFNTLYQIFYPYNKFDTISKIEHLEKHMLSLSYVDRVIEIVATPTDKRNADQIISHKSIAVPLEKTVTPSLKVVEPKLSVKVIEPKLSVKVIEPNSTNQKIITEPNKQEQKSHITVPNKLDTLFWSIYIAHYGYPEYLAIGNKYTNFELAEKATIMEHLKSSKHILKRIHPKITLGATQEIMSELMTNKKSTLLSINAYALYYKVNIIVENAINGTYLEYIYDKEMPADKWICLKYTERKQYGIDHTGNTRTNRGILVESGDKPLRSMSTFKVAELNELAAKFPTIWNDPERGTWKKADLYGKLWHHCVW